MVPSSFWAFSSTVRAPANDRFELEVFNRDGRNATLYKKKSAALVIKVFKSFLMLFSRHFIKKLGKIEKV